MKRISKHVPRINEKTKRVILEETIKDAIEEKVTAFKNAYNRCTFSIHSSCQWKNQVKQAAI